MATSQIDYPQPTVSQPDADTLRVTFGNQPTPGSRLSANQVLAALLAENIRTNGGGGGGGAITIADGADVAQGARADAAATTDAGTFSFISLFKRWLERWAAAVANTAPIGVLGRSRSLTDTVSGSLTAYADGDFVGTGGTVAAQNLAFTGAFSGAGAGATLTNLMVWTTGSLPLTIAVYRKVPTVTQADNAAFAPGADTDAIVDLIDLSTPVAVGSIFYSRLTSPITVQSSSVSGTTVCYIGLIANGAGTLTSATIEAVASFIPD